MRESLRIWKVTRPHVNISDCDHLLKILSPYHPDLPTCTKTLVHTARVTPRIEKLPGGDPGLYYHRGLEQGIRQSLLSFALSEVPQRLHIYLAIDGVSLTKSSTSQFWPIVGFIPSLPNSSIFEVGVYWGHSKPINSSIFLKKTIDEADVLSKQGMLWQGKKILIFVKAFICDAPARAWITCVKSHSSRLHGCSKCKGSGTSIGELRTNASFRAKTDQLHHHTRSVIEILRYLDCIVAVPLDPMHLCDLGIIKRFIEFLIGKHGSIPNLTLSPASIRALNISLLILRSCISRFDFARKPPKSINDIPRFKATECRQFLHYIGVVLFKKHLSSKLFRHFLLLHVAIRLLSIHPWCTDDNALAHRLLVEFVEKSSSIISEDFMCYNVHALLHLALDVLYHGPLYSFSAYRFENFYGYLLKFLKKTHKPLHQLARRLYERNQLSSLLNEAEVRVRDPNVTLSCRHHRGPLVPNCYGQQFDKAEKSDCWTLKTSGQDSIVYLEDLSVVQICNFVKYNGTNVIIGRKFRSKRNFYQLKLPEVKCKGLKEVSIESSQICEFLVSDPSPVLQAWDMKYIRCKAVNMDSLSSNTDVKSFFTAPHFMQKIV